VNVLEGGAVHVTLPFSHWKKIVSVSGKCRSCGDWLSDHKIP